MMHSFTTDIWHQALRDLINKGQPVAPVSAGASWRGRANKELLGYQTTVPMNLPLVLAPDRKLGLRFLVAEAAWILSGDNRVSTIAPYAKVIGDLSDDGVRFFGAYGPRFIDQLSYVLSCFQKDTASRQAVIEVWREQPRSSKDVPCTLSWQYLIRGDRLHMIATMRSSDIWTGWVYDVFNFSMTAAVVALELRRLDPVLFGNLELGMLCLTAGSQHLYDVDLPGAMEVLKTGPHGSLIAPLNLDEFQGAEALIEHLWALARKDGTARHAWLRELF